MQLSKDCAYYHDQSMGKSTGGQKSIEQQRKNVAILQLQKSYPGRIMYQKLVEFRATDNFVDLSLKFTNALVISV